MLGELLRAECRTRKASGESPTREELEARFPGLASPSQPGSDSDVSEGSIFRKGTAESALCTSFFGSIRSGVPRSASREPPTLSPGRGSVGYRLKAVLGRGGMGIVYLAEDEELHRPVAVKVLHPWIFLDSLLGEILLEEARTAARLKHASIVPVYDVGKQDDGSYFFVMEYVEGDSLAELIDARPIDHDQAVAWAEQLAEALDTRIDRASSTATSSRRTSSSIKTGVPGLPTWPRAARARASEARGGVLGHASLHGARADTRPVGFSWDGARTFGPWESCSTRCSPADGRSTRTMPRTSLTRSWSKIR